jgi:hypothetical protein
MPELDTILEGGEASTKGGLIMERSTARKPRLVAGSDAKLIRDFRHLCYRRMEVKSGENQLRFRQCRGFRTKYSSRKDLEKQREGPS